MQMGEPCGGDEELASDTELPANHPTKRFFDFGVPRHRCLAAVLWIGVDVVTTAMAQQVASGAHELTDEMPAFQAIATKIALVLTLRCGDRRAAA